MSGETRERVMEAVSRFGEPELRPRRKPSQRLAVWLPGLGEVLGRAHHRAIVQALEEAAAEKNLALEMVSAPVPKEPSDAVGVIEAAKVRGVLLLSVYSRRVRDALTEKWPVVLFFEAGRDEPLASIQPDDFTAGYLATKHLVERGHRRIAVAVGGGYRPVGFSNRFAGGYTLAMTEAGLAVDRSLIMRDRANLGPFSSSVGIPPAGPQFLELKPRPTAIIGRHETVVGVMRVLFRAGLRVPDDVSVIGYGPEGDEGVVSPKLTSIEFSPREMAEAALSALAAPERIRSVVTLPVRLDEGDSVRKIKAGKRKG